MECEILFFAQLKDAMNCDRLTLSLQEGATVSDALKLLSKQHEPVAQMQDRVAIAVDETYRPLDYILTDGCRIAFIPPVSGG